MYVPVHGITKGKKTMTQKELKRLGRSDLLELLVEQRRENEELRAQVAQLQKQLADRRLIMDNAGSIAEASLQLSGVFEAAQAACAQYVESVESLYSRQKQVCAKMEISMIAKCQQMERETKAKCEKMLSDAQTQSETYWNDVSKKAKDLTEAHAALQTLFQNSPDRFKK